MATPDVSVIIPVFNAQLFLDEVIASLREQTLENFEIIFVDDGSEDGSYAIMRNAAEADSRFRVLRQSRCGAGAARNCGLSAACGEYVIFLESPDLFKPQLLERLFLTAQENRADIVACNFSRFGTDGRDIPQTGLYTSWLPGGTTVFSYQHCPDYILRIASPVVWNKLYRREFLNSHHLRFDPLLSFDDISFVAVSMACAERITFVPDALVRSRISKTHICNDLLAVSSAVDSTVRQLSALPYCGMLKNAVARFVVETYISALKKYVPDFSAFSAKQLYQQVHETFRSGEYLQLQMPQLHNNELYREFCTVQKHSYDIMRKLHSKRLIVSLTSYPRRIGVVGQALRSIYSQTKKPDDVILWLAHTQFPGKEADLPEDLLSLIREKKLTVRWCDDLKSHKKYFYAFQEYADDLVVTIDDDLEYSPDMLACLYASYLLHPEAVSTVRSHLMVFLPDNTLLPYGRWIHETDSPLHTPCMQLMATSGAGTLYSPSLFRKEFFDWQVIRENCLHADDLWLKAMAVISDVPVVQARSHKPLRFLPGTQEDSLFVINSHQGQNDVQLQNIVRWTDSTFGSGVFIRKITEPVCGEAFMDLEAVAWCIEQKRRSMCTRLNAAQDELTAAKHEAKKNSEAVVLAEKKLEKSEQERKQIQQLKKQAEEKLKNTEKKWKQAEESKPISRQLRALKPQKQQETSLGQLMKLIIYYLAWIPEKVLALMMRFLRS